LNKKRYFGITSIVSGVTAITLFFVTLFSSSLAWFSDNTQVNMSEAVDHGSVLTQYFESGDGSQEKPYEIKYPIQLYYFAWLQNLGFFNEDSDKNGQADTVYFYLSDDIDMTDYTLPPIGTGEYPFVGNFDGQSKTISNLTVNNNENNVTDVPESGTLEGVQIVGFFGVVGNLEGGTQYSYATEANAVQNLVLENITVKTESDKALIGLAVGYMNGVVDSVGVIGSTVDISANTSVLSYTTNLSDYSAVGYCTDEYKSEVVIINTDVSDPTSETFNVIKDNTADGDGQGWGGSIDMGAMFSRLQAIMNGATINTSYVYKRTDLESATGKIITLSTEKAEKKVYADENIGSFVFSRRNDGYSEQYTYLSGGTSVTKYKYSYGEETIAYYIKDGENYLRLNGTNLQNTTGLSLATKWIFSDGENGGTVYADVDGIPYYLMANRTTLTVSEMRSTSSPTSWRYNNNQLSYTSGGTTYYLIFQNGAWRLSTDNTEFIGYRISYGNNYLTVSGNEISNTATEANASVWTFSNGTSGTASTNVNGTTYYLSYNNGLALSTNSQDAVSWTNTNNVYSCRVGTTTYYLVCNDGVWSLTTTQPAVTYKISTGSNYLTVSNGNIDDTTTEANAVSWNLSNGTSGGTISTVIDGTTYYLRYNNGLTLTTNSTQATSWTYSNNYLTYSTGGWFGSTYYLRYNNGWTTTTNSNRASQITLTATGSLIGLEEAYGVIETEIEETVATTIDYEEVSYKENGREVENGFNNENGSYNDDGNFSSTGAGVTYFPLSTNSDSDFTVKDSNTGYVVSSSYSIEKSEGQSGHNGTGDIRVSRYNKTSNNKSNLSNPTTPLTMTYKSVKSNTGFSTISNTNEDTMKKLGLEKYADCYDDFQTSIQSYYYGLHFMEATININSLVTLPKAKIINKEYVNYQVPTNCINFHLAEQGFINFFAGTYFKDNDSFFSLHKIERNAETQEITAIKEIEYIYGKLDSGNLIHSPYYYKYVGDANYYDKDGKATSTLPTGYDVIFETEWIKSPTGVGNGDNKLYYFEVPVNAGEYALGSAGEDKIGAYLIYLDLAANAQILERTEIIEKSTTIKSTVSMPSGVGFIQTSDEKVDPLNNAFVTVGSGYGTAGGKIEIEKTGNVITQNSTNGNVTAEYVGSGITLKDGSGKEMQMSENILTVLETTVVERITWYDHNIAMDAVEPTTVTTRTTVTNGSGQITSQTVEITLDGEIVQNGGFDFSADGSSDKISALSDFVHLGYILPSDATVTVTYVYTAATESAAASYAITVTSDKEITVSAELLKAGVSVTLNGMQITSEKQSIVVSAA